MTKYKIIMLTGIALFAPFAATSPALAQQAKPAATQQKSEGEKLQALFASDDEANLKRNPLIALYRGDLRYADQLGDGVSEAYFDAERKAAENSLAQLGKIDRGALSPTDQIAYDVYARQQADTLRGLSKELLDLTAVRPLNHFFGFHTFYPTFASGKGAAPFRNLLDYQNNLKRHKQFILLIDMMIARFREGQKSGVVETKLTIRNVIEQLDTQLAQKTEESPYYGPVNSFPKSVRPQARMRLKKEYKDIIEQGLYPALTKLRSYLRDEYLADAREGVGLSYMKGGDRLYEYLIEQTTTLPLKPDDIHQLGLREVARIRQDMEKAKQELGFTGSLAEFFEYLRSDPKFKPKSREALTQGYYDIGKAVDAKIGDYFKILPKAKLEIRPYEPFREKFEAGGSYDVGTPDGSRPGVFYFNAYDLPSRTTPGMVTLYLHEGAPGHHFQISLAQENEALPSFIRYGGNTAYVEGWALYAETLGYPMGFYRDPVARIGTLSDEMLRAMRLVVDTGLHSKQWTREQSIQYMLDNSDMGKTDATAEVERYIAIPSQALAYKIGALKIQELRDRAAKKLGAKFDIREFHQQILGTGALPLSVLEAKIDRWIAAAQCGRAIAKAVGCQWPT